MSNIEVEDKRPPMPQNFTWYSICSIHRDYHASCNNCNVGQWINDTYHELDHWLYTKDYKLWHQWANRTTSPGEPGHEARTFLERIFPGLRKK